MRALTLRHYLRLVEYDGPDQTPIYTSRMQSESYDEIVISRPSAKIKALFREETASPTRVYSTIQNRSKNSGSKTDIVNLPVLYISPLPLALLSSYAIYI